MMEIKNNSTAKITTEEREALIQAGRLLGEAFKRKLYCATINGHKENTTKIYGVAFAFDKNS